ncbi:MAG: hypothetical protein NVSMB62_28410 [Acidobacteriaceae bacterium]
MLSLKPDSLPRNATLPPVIRWFWAVVLGAAALTPVVAWLEFQAGWTKEYWFPLQLPWFSDLLEYIPTFKLVHTPAFFHPAVSPFAYPAVAALWFALIYATGHPVAVYMALAASTMGFALWHVRRALLAEGIGKATALAFPLTVLLCSFPFWRLIPQGNSELFLWIFVAAGLWRYLRGCDDQAAVLWGLAAATKLYPLVLLLLFVPRWKIRPFLLGLGIFVLSSVIALWYLGPTVAEAWHGELHNVFGYQGLRVNEWTMNTVATNHSAFTLVKFFALVANHGFGGLTLPYYAAGCLLTLALFLGRLRSMPVANQILALSVVMVTLPTISYFHTLTHLYAPWLMLVFIAIRAQRAGRLVPGLAGAMACFVPLFVSYTLYTFRAVWLFGGLIQTLALLFLLLYALQYPFDDRLQPPQIADSPKPLSTPKTTHAQHSREDTPDRLVSCQPIE